MKIIKAATMIIIAAIIMAGQAAAAKNYTKAQLQKMTAAGRYPAQGTVSTESKQVGFAACTATIDSISSASAGYPTETIVSTGAARDKS